MTGSIDMTNNIGRPTQTQAERAPDGSKLTVQVTLRQRHPSIGWGIGCKTFSSFAVLDRAEKIEVEDDPKLRHVTVTLTKEGGFWLVPTGRPDVNPERINTRSLWSYLDKAGPLVLPENKTVKLTPGVYTAGGQTFLVQPNDDIYAFTSHPDDWHRHHESLPKDYHLQVPIRDTTGTSFSAVEVKVER